MEGHAYCGILCTSREPDPPEEGIPGRPGGQGIKGEKVFIKTVCLDLREQLVCLGDLALRYGVLDSIFGVIRKPTFADLWSCCIIQGEQGRPGTAGEPGYPGIPGTQGMKGEKGNAGEKGIQGQKGENGRPGIPGQQGATGLNGAKGEPSCLLYFGMEGYNTVTTVSFMVLLPPDHLVHQAQLAQKGLVVFLAYKEMMVFRVFRGLLDDLAPVEQEVYQEKMERKEAQDLGSLGCKVLLDLQVLKAYLG
ncbi:hypothetical protein lerEdw1_001374 [Lerista edwardsae]|nr:hypothetical protein lerEdw1_001374 [Lerista edwardsae]